ncbi:MAG: hypothetical protein JXO49_03985 [Deltaproteobacteria bacterium]|nr:hypothetical protein [Candidatus Anaeroferrophillus wilburensis]MBN2888489.1 hypothetical protein [Deltaproteobacteria bacterium]
MAAITSCLLGTITLTVATRLPLFYRRRDIPSFQIITAPTVFLSTPLP